MTPITVRASRSMSCQGTSRMSRSPTEIGVERAPALSYRAGVACQAVMDSPRRTRSPRRVGERGPIRSAGGKQGRDRYHAETSQGRIRPAHTAPRASAKRARGHEPEVAGPQGREAVHDPRNSGSSNKSPSSTNSQTKKSAPQRPLACHVIPYRTSANAKANRYP